MSTAPEEKIIGVWTDHLSSACQVMFSAGTERAISTSRHPYSSTAFVPRAPWRTISVPHHSDCKKHPPRSANFVAIINMPEAFTDRMGQISDARGSQRIAAIQDAIKGLSTFFNVGTDIVCDGVQANSPGFPTVTIGFDQRHLLGMHIDNWDHLPPGKRDHARQRVSINIGSEPRYFLFMRPSIRLILKALDRSVDYMAHDIDGIVVRFLMRFPCIPVIRIKVKPGQAYIAPTENIVHDASSRDNAYPCSTLVFRGRFMPRDSLQWVRCG